MAVWQERGGGPHVPIAPIHVQMLVRISSLGFILLQWLFSPFYFSSSFLVLVLLFNKISELSHCIVQWILPLDKNKVRREAEKRTADTSWYCMVCVHWYSLQTCQEILLCPRGRGRNVFHLALWMWITKLFYFWPSNSYCSCKCPEKNSSSPVPVLFPVIIPSCSESG